MKYLIASLLSAAILWFTGQTPINNQVHANKQTVSAAAPEKVAQVDTPKITAITVNVPVQSEPPTPTPPVKPVEVVAEPVTPKSLAQSKAASYGWTGDEWLALEELWHKESGWNPNARNKSSGACGIPQALPCSKIPNPKDTESQIDWGLGYIHKRYGSPSKALAFWKHKAPNYNGSNWY